MIDINQYKVQAVTMIREAIKVAKNEYPEQAFPPVEITWSNRMTSTGGKWQYKHREQTHHIILSQPLLAKDPQQFLEQVPHHEAAHYLCYVVHKYNPSHGIEWQQMMLLIGAKPYRTHSMGRAKPKREMFTHEATCGCTTHKISKKRRTLMLTKGRQYTCTNCNQHLTLTR